MAGEYSGFSASQFRTAIKFAMNMGKPDDVNQRVSFAWSVRRTFAAADEGENPFDWTAIPATEIAPPGVEIDCAVEFVEQPTLLSNAGKFTNSKIVVTILDTDYTSIFDDAGVRADLIIADGNTYEVEFESPPMGLFDVTVHQIHARARDES